MDWLERRDGRDIDTVHWQIHQLYFLFFIQLCDPARSRTSVLLGDLDDRTLTAGDGCADGLALLLLPRIWCSWSSTPPPPNPNVSLRFIDELTLLCSYSPAPRPGLSLGNESEGERGFSSDELLDEPIVDVSCFVLRPPTALGTGVGVPEGSSVEDLYEFDGVFRAPIKSNPTNWVTPFRIPTRIRYCKKKVIRNQYRRPRFT